MILAKKALGASGTFAERVLSDRAKGEQVGASTVTYGGCVFWSIHLDWPSSGGEGQLEDLKKEIGSTKAAIFGDWNLELKDMNASNAVKALSSSDKKHHAVIPTCFSLVKGGLCLDHAVSTSEGEVQITGPFPEQFKATAALKTIAAQATKLPADKALAFVVEQVGSDHIPVPFLVTLA